MSRKLQITRSGKLLCATEKFLKMSRAKLFKLAGLLAAWALPGAAQAQAQDLLFTGEVFSRQAQEIFVPLTNNWQARISKMKREGTKVEVGEVAVEFDGAEV